MCRKYSNVYLQWQYFLTNNKWRKHYLKWLHQNVRKLTTGNIHYSGVLHVSSRYCDSRGNHMKLGRILREKTMLQKYSRQKNTDGHHRLLNIFQDSSFPNQVFISKIKRFLFTCRDFHLMFDWEGAKIIYKQPNRRTQQIKEAIWLAGSERERYQWIETRVITSYPTCMMMPFIISSEEVDL